MPKGSPLTGLIGQHIEVLDENGQAVVAAGKVVDVVKGPLLLLDSGKYVPAANPRVEHLTTVRKVGFKEEKVAEAGQPEGMASDPPIQF